MRLTKRESANSSSASGGLVRHALSTGFVRRRTETKFFEKRQTNARTQVGANQSWVDGAPPGVRELLWAHLARRRLPACRQAGFGSTFVAGQRWKEKLVACRNDGLWFQKPLSFSLDKGVRKKISAREKDRLGKETFLKKLFKKLAPPLNILHTPSRLNDSSPCAIRFFSDIF